MTTTRARTTSRGRRHHTLLYARTRRCGWTRQTGRAGRGRRPTPTMLLTRLGPLPARQAPLRAGGLPQTGWTSRRSTTCRRTHTRSGHTHRQTHGGAVNGSGSVGPGNAPAPEMVAAEKAEPATASHCIRDPDRLKNSLARSCKEGLGCGMELPATAGADSTHNPELPRSWEAPRASARSRWLSLGCQLLSHNWERSRDRYREPRDHERSRRDQRRPEES